MRQPFPIVLVRSVVAYGIALPALAMPYTVRAGYVHTIARIAHAPFKSFAYVARFFLRELNIKVVPDASPARSFAPATWPNPEVGEGPSVVVLYSGGTDSTCAAALVAEAFPRVHLLTFWEHATRHSPFPDANVSLLRRHFPNTQFTAENLSVDGLVRFFSYEGYGRAIMRHGMMALSTCAYSALSWHVRTIAYCLQHDIKHVVDGLTRELMHFPGHMDDSVRMIHDLYARHGITYSNPVREWETPPDQQFIDRVIVGHRGIDALMAAETRPQKTTGRYLHERGMFPSPNMKGSAADFAMQHDCYPFILYNIIAFWIYMPYESYDSFCARVSSLMADKVSIAESLLAEYVVSGRHGKLSSLI